MNKMIDKFKDNDQTAIIYDGKKYSYNELYIKIKEIESFIKDKIKSGEEFIRVEFKPSDCK